MFSTDTKRIKTFLIYLHNPWYSSGQERKKYIFFKFQFQLYLNFFYLNAYATYYTKTTMFHNRLLQIYWNYRFSLIKFLSIFFPLSFPIILHISDLFVAVWLEVTSVRGQAVAVGMIVRLVQALAVALVYERIQLDLKTRSWKKD